MKILRTFETICPCCMERHTVQVVSVQEHILYKNMHIEYAAEYCYCDKAEETYADEAQMSANYAAMREACARKPG